MVIFLVIIIIFIVLWFEFEIEIERTKNEELENKIVVLYYLMNKDIKIKSYAFSKEESLRELLDSNEAIICGYDIILVDKFGIAYDRVSIKKKIK